MNLQDIAKSPVKLKILSFFHKNPSVIDTARSIAIWTKQNPTLVKRALEELVKSKVLAAHRTSSTTAYAYTQDNDIISAVAKILKKSKWSQRKSR